jgi:hypothetical protein
MYVIFLPPNVTTDQMGGNFGYHSYTTLDDGTQVAYAVIAWRDSWTGSNNVPYGDSMFITETHEIYEAVTDPFGAGWRAAGGDEIGDACSRSKLNYGAITDWDTGAAGSISVQKEWSVKSCACVDVRAYGASLIAASSGGSGGGGHTGGGSGGGGTGGGPKCGGHKFCPQ